MRRLLSLVIIPFVVSACGGGGSTPTGPDARACVVNVQNTAVNIGFAVGSGVVIVNADAGCTWTAAVAPASNFLSVTGGANGDGAGTIAFAVIENTGAQSRAATIVVTPRVGAPVNITVTQAAGPPPIVWNVPVLGPAVVGVPFRQQLPAAQGGTGTFHYQLDVGGRFPPIALILAPDGVLSGTINAAVAAGRYVFRACAVDTTARQMCIDISIDVSAAPTGGGADAVLGDWSGNITLQVGCLTGLPRTFPWTGTFRRGGSTGYELVVSVPFALVSNEVLPVTINGTSLRFTIDFDSLYTFLATFSGDFRSLNGTFSGGNCNVPPTIINPSGTWTGTKR